jgi:hypothetical protein
MRSAPWPRRNLPFEPGEDLLYRGRCSWAARRRWISLVGGEVLVTTHRLVFMPNLLAAFLGRRSWHEPLGEIDHTDAEPLDAGRVFGALHSLRVVLTTSAGTAPRSRTIVLRSEGGVAELSAWIDRAKWWL